MTRCSAPSGSRWICSAKLGNDTLKGGVGSDELSGGVGNNYAGRR